MSTFWRRRKKPTKVPTITEQDVDRAITALSEAAALYHSVATDFIKESNASKGDGDAKGRE